MGFTKPTTRDCKNPHPWLRVRVLTGTGAGCPEKPQGSPLQSLYSKRILNYLTSKGFRRHIWGTVRKPEQLIECNGSYYKQGSLAPLTDEDLEKHEETIESYDQMQAAVCEVIYWTIDKTTFLQVKNKTDAMSMWRKVASIHADKGTLYETNLLMQLQNTRYIKKESMREHIAKMNSGRG